MIGFNTTLRSIRIALALTALTPVPLLADAPVTARQMLAQAQVQRQDLAVSGEMRKISDRGLIINDARAAETPNAPKPAYTVQSIEPVAPAPATDGTAQAEPLTLPRQTTEPAPAIVPATQPATTSRIEILPAPASPAPAAPTPPVSDAIAAPAAPAVIPAATAAPATAPVAAPAAAPAPAATVASTPAPAAVTPAATAEPRKASKPSPATRVAAKQPRRSNAQEFSPDHISSHIERVLNRPEIRSLIAQYGRE